MNLVLLLSTISESTSKFHPELLCLPRFAWVFPCCNLTEIEMNGVDDQGIRIRVLSFVVFSIHSTMCSYVTRSGQDIKIFQMFLNFSFLSYE